MAVGVHPTARGLLAWMQANSRRLRALMAEEAAGADDLSPAGDAAVRAQLRFVADALVANAGPATEGALRAFRDGLPARLADPGDALGRHVDLLGEAAAFEADRQFGSWTAGDEGLADMLGRRVRVGAWMRLFLDALDEALPGPPRAPAALDWMAANQGHLADTIFSMDRSAKEREIARGGPDAVASPEVVNRIGQATMLQSHVRFLVEAIAHSAGPRGG